MRTALFADAGIVPAGIATSSFRITWSMPDGRVPEVIGVLHGHYIEQQQPLLT